MNIRSKFIRGHFYHLEGSLYGVDEYPETVLTRFVSKQAINHPMEDGSSYFLHFRGIAGTDNFWMSRAKKDLTVDDSFENLRIKVREIFRNDLPLYISMPHKSEEYEMLLKGLV